MSSEPTHPNDPQGAMHWAVHALGDDDAILDQLDQSIPVRLIATMGVLTSAIADEPVADADRRAAEHRFDFLPVKSRCEGSIIGLFRRNDNRRISNATVQQVMQTLDGATNLISADAPLSDFVATADTSPARLVLDRAEIKGLVTLSDLQRLPVRTFLFGLFIHLELLLTQELKRCLGPNVEPFDLLPPDKASRARNAWTRTLGSEMDRDIYSTLYFSDKIVIAQGLHILGKASDTIGGELLKVQQFIRHPIAHGKSFALTRQDAHSMVRATRVMRVWIKEFREFNRNLCETASSP